MPGNKTHPGTICMYTPSADGGHARYVWELMTEMANSSDNEYHYELVTSEDLEEQFKTDLYPVHPILPILRHRNSYANPLSWAASRVLHYPLREWKFLEWLRGRPDIVGVHLQEWKPWLAIPMIRRIRQMGKKVYFTAHNVYPHKYPPGLPKALINRWIRQASLLCNGLFVLTDALAGELEKFLGEPHPPISVVPHGVWTVNRPATAPSIEERLSWKRLLFFGTIRRNKGLDLLLQAADRLPGYSITIAGEPSEPDYFQSEILPLVNRLRSAGVQINLIDRFVSDDEVASLFATHSAIVLPYTREFVAQSGVVYMALAYELPAVASEAGGLKDLFNDFKIGVTFHDFSPEGLANAVQQLFSGDLRQGLAREMRAAKQRFSWRKSARATIDGYLAAETTGREENDCTIIATSAH